MKDAVFPVLLIVVGLAWLLNSLDWLPEIHWLWILGLAGAGLAIMGLDGITKSSIIAGPMLMLVARSPSIPESRKLRRTDHIQEDRDTHHG
jgi:hypothetical protein